MVNRTHSGTCCSAQHQIWEQEGAVLTNRVMQRQVHALLTQGAMLWQW